MNSNKNLVFLGMMGSGKSSIGAMVSEKLNIPHFVATSGNDWRVYCKESGIWKSRDGVKPPQCTAVSENIQIAVSTLSSSFFVFPHIHLFLSFCLLG